MPTLRSVPQQSAGSIPGSQEGVSAEMLGLPVQYLRITPAPQGADSLELGRSLASVLGGLIELETVQRYSQQFYDPYLALLGTLKEGSDASLDYRSLPQISTRESLESALTQGGFDLDVADPEEPDPLTRTALRYQTLLDTSLNLEQAAYMLDTSEEEVLGQLRARRLYGVHADEDWKLPLFQFEGNRPLPGIGEVVPLLHKELHPITVLNWFTTPNADLLVRGKEVSPRQWLLEGRDPDTVTRLATDL